MTTNTERAPVHGRLVRGIWYWLHLSFVTVILAIVVVPFTDIPPTATSLIYAPLAIAGLVLLVPHSLVEATLDKLSRRRARPNGGVVGLLFALVAVATVATLLGFNW